MATTRDGSTRLELSLTTVNSPIPTQGYRDLVDEVFCPFGTEQAR